MVWDYTPRQAFAFLQLGEKRLSRERASHLLVAMMGARGKWESAQKLVRDWENP